MITRHDIPTGCLLVGDYSKGKLETLSIGDYGKAHNNKACAENGIETVGGYDSWQPYRQPEEDLKREGFDVLVFVPSQDEENGLVTCGNAILGGSEMKLERTPQ